MKNLLSLRRFALSPSLAEGDKGGGLKAQNHSGAKSVNNESTHPLASSAREGESLLDSRKNKIKRKQKCIK